MTSTQEASGSPALLAMLGVELEKIIDNKLADITRLIKNLNLTNSQNTADIKELREKLSKLNEDVGFDFQGTRLIPRAAAAKLLCRTPRTMKRWERLKRLEPLYPSENQVYYRLDQVQALVESLGQRQSTQSGALGK